MKSSFSDHMSAFGLIGLCALALFSTASAQTQRWTRIVGTGDTAPGTGGAVFEEILTFAVNDSGKIAFSGWVSGAGVLNSNRFGLWSGTKSGFSLLLRQGEDYIPFTSYGIVQGFDMNNAGDIAAIVGLEGGAPIELNNEGIFLFSGGMRSLLLREGDMLTGAADFGDFRHNSIRLRDDGRIAFEAALVEADPLEVGYFAGDVGAFDTSVRRGNVAPDLGNFDSLDGLHSDMRNSIGLTTVVIKGSQGATEGLWMGVNGLLSKIAVEGDPVPFGGGFQFFGFTHATIDPGGRVLFQASCSNGGTFESGIFTYISGGSISTLFRKGDPAPGLAGAVLDGFSFPFQSGNGRIGFKAKIDGPGVTAANDSVLYWQDGSGRFVPILRSGSAIAPNVAPSRVVDWFSIKHAGGVAAKNRLLVRVHFTDGGAALYFVETGIPQTIIRGKSRKKTSRKRYKLRGLARDDEAVSLVQYRIGGKKWRRAKGKNSWRQKVRIRKKRTRFFVRSFDFDGNVSKKRRVVVRRR